MDLLTDTTEILAEAAIVYCDPFLPGHLLPAVGLWEREWMTRIFGTGLVGRLSLGGFLVEGLALIVDGVDMAL